MKRKKKKKKKKEVCALTSARISKDLDSGTEGDTKKQVHRDIVPKVTEGSVLETK